jgi:hypothetical protein
MLWRLIKALFYLAVLGGIGLVGYAYLGPIFLPGDFAPPQQEVVKPVSLEPDA